MVHKLIISTLFTVSSFIYFPTTTYAQSTFAQQCRNSDIVNNPLGRQSTQYFYVFGSYEVCAHLSEDKSVSIEGNNGTWFTLPRNVSLDACINYMRSNQTYTCL